MKTTIFDLLHENAHLDNDLLFKKDKLGDDFSVIRDVDFAFKTVEKERADDLAEFVNGKNFGRATVSGDAELYWVIVILSMPITQHVLCSISGFMVCLSRLLGVEYDGWGSVTANSGLIK